MINTQSINLTYSNLILSRFPSNSVFLLGRGEIPPNIPANALLDFGVVGGSPALFPFSVLIKKKSKNMAGWSCMQYMLTIVQKHSNLFTNVPVQGAGKAILRYWYAINLCYFIFPIFPVYISMLQISTETLIIFR